MTLRFGSFRRNFFLNEKFRLSSFDGVFSEESYRYLEGGFPLLSWEKKETYFYTQFKAVISPDLDNPLAQFFTKEVFFPLKEKIEEAMGLHLQNGIKVIAHKLVTSDEIGVHNDYADAEYGHENIRLILQFGGEVVGGELFFLKRRERSAVLKSYPHQANQAICFEITPHSFHYVSEVKGERYTLILYFWEEGREPNESFVPISS